MTEFIIVFVASYIIHALGVTVGYHRMISHRAFYCPKIVEYFWVMAGYLAFEGSPIWWATIHRAHHRYVDTPLDPHSPRFGLHNAHFGWLMHQGYADHMDPEKQTKDLVDDPLYKFLEQGGNWHRAHFMAFSTCFLFRALILVLFGWQAALASLLAGFAVLQIPLMLNVVCHIPKLGYKTYACDDDSVNVWWVGILAMGEGWHNNHHAAPGSAQTGIKPWEVDASWLVIRTMKLLGLANRIHVADFDRLAATKLLPDAAFAMQDDKALIPSGTAELSTMQQAVQIVAAANVNLPAIERSTSAPYTVASIDSAGAAPAIERSCTTVQISEAQKEVVAA